ncbi:MAG: hypothetical protein ACREGH_03625 [Minisyncoccia bacterium]
MKANVIKSGEIDKIRYPVPKSFYAAAGMLRGKLPDGVKYQKKIRKEWDARLKRQRSK